MEQRRGAAGNTPERAPDASTLARHLMGNSTPWQRHSRATADPDAGSYAPRTSGRPFRGIARSSGREYGLVNNGRLIAALITVATLALVLIGTLWPVPSAAAY